MESRVVAPRAMGSVLGMSDRRRLIGRRRATAVEAVPTGVSLGAPISTFLSLSIFIKSGPEPILP
jgi:hypothetical protein